MVCCIMTSIMTVSDTDFLLIVDICITTPYKELERVCILADFLAKSELFFLDDNGLL